jgi:hypothetical protein
MEMPADQELTTAAIAMIAASQRGRSARTVLKKLCPHVYRQISQDAKTPLLLSLWGRSVNFDEFAGKTIVHPAILRAIGELAGIPVRGRIVHAGLEHTYGYLFSLIETPYGFKRERWTSTSLESGFGIERSLLGERPLAGTLLANLTWFLGNIVFRGEARLLSRMEGMAAAVAPELSAYDFSQIRGDRVIERIPAGSGRTASIFTDLIPFPHPAATPNSANTLLVYSVQPSEKARIKLITAFAINQAAVREITNSIDPKKQVPIRLRYNAYLRGYWGGVYRGRRSLHPTGKTTGAQN